MKYKTKTVIYSFNLYDELPVELVADLTPQEYIVDITIRDGKFVSANYKFKGTYTIEQWKILEIISKTIDLILAEEKQEENNDDV